MVISFIVGFFVGGVTGVLFGRKNVATANAAATLANRAAAATQAELNALKAKVVPAAK